MLFGYLRAEPLFKKLTLFSPLSHPLILASQIFAILKNVIALYFCAFYVLFEYLRAEPLFKKFTLISLKILILNDRSTDKKNYKFFLPFNFWSHPEISFFFIRQSNSRTIQAGKKYLESLNELQN